MTTLVAGALLAAVVAAAAWRARVLTVSGAIAALFVGTAVFGSGGWAAAAVLFAFFLPSAVLSRVGRARKRALTDVGKQGPRDAWQVLANGGVAAICAVLAHVLPAPLSGALTAAFAGAFAAASADTWGTEIGTLVRSAPRSILTFRPIAPGLSGGITFAGTIATFAGAAVVGVVARVTGVAPFAAIAAGGIAGAFADSVLGSSAQALRWCPRCERSCEIDPHDCGTPAQMRRGISWLENDAVNLAATLCGSIVAALWFVTSKR